MKHINCVTRGWDARNGYCLKSDINTPQNTPGSVVSLPSRYPRKFRKACIGLFCTVLPCASVSSTLHLQDPCQGSIFQDEIMRSKILRKRSRRGPLPRETIRKLHQRC